MRNNRALSTARRRLMLLAVCALGLASAAPAAQAQGEADKPAAGPSAPPAKPNPVEGLTVSAPRPLAGVLGVPPDKKADFDAEAAKDKAFRDYRKSTPPLTSDPNDQSKDFPGLQAYIPQ